MDDLTVVLDDYKIAAFSKIHVEEEASYEAVSGRSGTKPG
jgi:hypothetical protein